MVMVPTVSVKAPILRVPPAMVTGPVARILLVPYTRLPALTVVVPVKLLGTTRVVVPAPSLVRPPAPWVSVPLKVVLPAPPTTRVKLAPVMLLAFDRVSVPASALMRALLPVRVTVFETVFEPVILRIAPVLIVLLMFKGLAKVTPPVSCSEPLPVIDTVPAVPKALILPRVTMPDERVVLPVYVLATAKEVVPAPSFVTVPLPKVSVPETAKVAEPPKVSP